MERSFLKYLLSGSAWLFANAAPAQYAFSPPGSVYAARLMQAAENIASLHYDTINLFFPNTSKAEECNFSNYINWKDSLALVTSPHPDTLFHIWNLTRPERSRDISTPSQDGKDCAQYFSSPDSFYLLTGKCELMRYSRGKWTLLCDDVNKKIQQDGLRVKYSIMPFELFVENDSILYTALTLNQKVRGTYSKWKYNFPITARINYKTGEAKYIGAGQPKKLQTANYGMLQYTYQHYYNGKIYYSFEVIPEIWEYDIKRDTMMVHPVRSRYQTKEFTPMKTRGDRDDAQNYQLASGRYLKEFIHDPYRNLYYWFYVLPLPQKNETGYFNTYSDSKISLMVLDEKFNILAEQLLPGPCFFVFYSAVSKDGLFINYGPVIKPEKYGTKFLKISVTK